MVKGKACHAAMAEMEIVQTFKSPPSPQKKELPKMKSRDEKFGNSSLRADGFQRFIEKNTRILGVILSNFDYTI